MGTTRGRCSQRHKCWLIENMSKELQYINQVTDYICHRQEVVCQSSYRLYSLNTCEILCLLRLSARFIKIDKKWKDYALNNVIYGLFQPSRANNSKVTGLIRSEFELVWVPVLVNCKFDKDLINNERASVETSFSHYSLCEICQCSSVRNTEVNDPIWLKFELIWDFTPVLNTCKIR